MGTKKKECIDESKQPKIPQQIWDYNDPDRPPNWRYINIRRIMAKPADQQRFTFNKDIWQNNFYAWIAEFVSCQSEEEKYIVRKKSPGIYQAWRMYKYTPVELSGLMEGFILADIEQNDIADQFSILPSTVEWYESIFFDVRSRLTSHMFMENNVLRPIFDKSRTAFNYKKVNYETATAYRTIGYRGGKVALELLATNRLSTDAKPLNKDLATAYLHQNLLASVSGKGNVIANSKSFLKKPDFAVLQQSIAIAKEAAARGNLDVIANVSQTLQSMAPIFGNQITAFIEEQIDDNPELQQAIINGIEPRATTQIMINKKIALSDETRKMLSYEKPADK